jgi:hypothetical protein
MGTAAITAARRNFFLLPVPDVFTTEGIVAWFWRVLNGAGLDLVQFQTVDLGCAKGNTAYTMIAKPDPHSRAFLQLFNGFWKDPKKMQDITDKVIESISAVYQENPPVFIYFIILYNRGLDDFELIAFLVIRRENQHA